MRKFRPENLLSQIFWSAEIWAIFALKIFFENFLGRAKIGGIWALRAQMMEKISQSEIFYRKNFAKRNFLWKIFSEEKILSIWALRAQMLENFANAKFWWKFNFQGASRPEIHGSFEPYGLKWEKISKEIFYFPEIPAEFQGQISLGACRRPSCRV